MSKTHTHTPEQIAEALLRCEDTLEGRLLKKKLLRELYKTLGDPTREDFPDVFNFNHTYSRQSGYTTFIDTYANYAWLDTYNNQPTDWRIKYPSETKRDIVERYTRAGWHARVQAYNVTCSRLVRHPRYKHIGVEFVSTRDRTDYRYILIKE